MKKLSLLLVLICLFVTACDEGGVNEEEAVFVTDNEGDIVVGANGGVVVVAVTTNLEYSVEIPEEAQSWLSVADTRAIRMEKLTFTVTKNEADAERSAVVKLLGSDNTELQSLSFVQKGVNAEEEIPTDKTQAIEFQDENTKLLCTLHWDLNEDGELSYEEAVAVTDLGTTFKGSSIVAFTELNYFTSLQKIADNAFEGCASLIKITLPKQITTISASAFNGCINIKNITIPDSITTIEDSAFSGCTSLERVDISDIAAWCNISFGNSYSNPLYYAENLYLNNELVADLIIPDSVTEIVDFAFSYCTSLTSIIIPDSVTSIGDYAFRYCTSLTNITIHDSVTKIGDAAFYNCSSLTSVTIPDSVTEIGDATFYKCTSLTSVTIPDSVTEIGNATFSGCMGELIINSKIIEYDSSNGWLTHAEFSKITIGNSVTKIGDSAFEYCSSLTNITIPNSVTEIGGSAFEYCTSLTDVAIPDSVIEIGEYTFRYCTSLTSITIPNSVAKIGEGIFMGCPGLRSITIPDSISEIKRATFANCISLTSITIPRSITSIGEYAFQDCTSLTSVYCKPLIPPTGNNYMFDNNDSSRKIYVPRESVKAYKSAEYWSNYADYIVGYDF